MPEGSPLQSIPLSVAETPGHPCRPAALYRLLRSPTAPPPTPRMSPKESTRRTLYKRHVGHALAMWGSRMTRIQN